MPRRLLVELAAILDGQKAALLPDKLWQRRYSLCAVLVLHPGEQSHVFHNTLRLHEFRLWRVTCPIQPLRELVHRRFQKALLYLQRALGDVHAHADSIHPQHGVSDCLTSHWNMAERDHRYTPCTLSSSSGCLLFIPCLLLQASPLSLQTRELGRHLIHGTQSQAHGGMRGEGDKLTHDSSQHTRPQ